MKRPKVGTSQSSPIAIRSRRSGAFATIRTTFAEVRSCGATKSIGGTATAIRPPS